MYACTCINKSVCLRRIPDFDIKCVVYADIRFVDEI